MAASICLIKTAPSFSIRKPADTIASNSSINCKCVWVWNNAGVCHADFARRMRSVMHALAPEIL